MAPPPLPHPDSPKPMLAPAAAAYIQNLWRKRQINLLRRRVLRLENHVTALLSAARIDAELVDEFAVKGYICISTGSYIN